MITIDASLAIAHLNPHDSHHQVATAFLRDSEGERLLIHALNLAEVLIGGVRVGRGEEMLSDLYAVGIDVADRTEGEPLRLARLRVECGLKPPGCCALDAALVTESALGGVHVSTLCSNVSPHSGPSHRIRV